MRTRAFIILGLSGLAVTQPLLDLFGQNPEFFVAGNYSRAQIVWFAAADRTRPAARRHRRHGARHVGQPTRSARSCSPSWWPPWRRRSGSRLLRTLGLDQIVVVVGCWRCWSASAWPCSCVRTRGIQLFVSYLAVANLFFLGSFLFLSPTSELVAGGSVRRRRRGRRAGAPRPGRRRSCSTSSPAATLMRADGSLNEERYPGLRRAGVGEHVVPQRVEPVQPDPPRRAVDPRRHGWATTTTCRRGATIRATCSRCSATTCRSTATSR